jgi:hypothetical protein
MTMLMAGVGVDGGVEGGVGEVVMWDDAEFGGLCGFNHGRCFEH